MPATHAPFALNLQEGFNLQENVDVQFFSDIFPFKIHYPLVIFLTSDATQGTADGTARICRKSRQARLAGQRRGSAQRLARGARGTGQTGLWTRGAQRLWWGQLC